MRSVRKLSLVLFLAIALTACGGGGGGGVTTGGGNTGGGGNPDPDPNGSLAINDQNAELVVAAMSLLEGSLAIAQEGASRTVVFGTPSGQQLVDCEPQGSLQISLTDNDGDQAISAGDRLVFDFAGCQSSYMNGLVTGGMTLDIDEFAVAADGARVVGWLASSGTVTVQDVNEPALSSELGFAFQLEFDRSTLEVLSAVAGTQGFIAIGIAGITERISEFTLLKETSIRGLSGPVNSLESTIDLEMFYDSVLFDGSFTCVNDGVLITIGNSVQDANVVCTGANDSAVRIRLGNEVQLDPEGDGTFERFGFFNWFDVVEGFLYENSGLQLEILLAEVATDTVALVHNDAIYDASADRLIVVTAATDASNPNALVAFSPDTYAVTPLTTFADEPAAVALMPDRSAFIVGFTTGEVQKIDASSLQVLWTGIISSNDPASNTYEVLDVAVNPQDPSIVAVNFRYAGTGVEDVAIFADDVQLPNRYRPATGNGSDAGEEVVFSDDGSRLFTYRRPGSPGASLLAVELLLDASGVAEVAPRLRFGGEVVWAEGRLFSHGSEYDPTSKILIEKFTRDANESAIDTTRRRYYGHTDDVLSVLNLDTGLEMARYEIARNSEAVVSHMLAADDKLVFRTADDLRVLDLDRIAFVADQTCGFARRTAITGEAYAQFACETLAATYNLSSGHVYVGLTDTIPGRGNSIGVLDAATSTVVGWVRVSANPKALTVSADGSRLYVSYFEVEKITVIDTVSLAVVDEILVGDTTIAGSFVDLEPLKVVRMVAAPAESDTIIVTLDSNASGGSFSFGFDVYRDGARLPDRLERSELLSNVSSPYGRVVFDLAGSPYSAQIGGSFELSFEALSLGMSGLAASGTDFVATSATWWPYDLAYRSNNVFTGSGDVVDLVAQTSEVRFDHTDVPFGWVETPYVVAGDTSSSDVYFAMKSSALRTGISRYDGATGARLGAVEFDEFAFLPDGTIEPSLFAVGADKVAVIGDYRLGLAIFDKATID